MRSGVASTFRALAILAAVLATAQPFLGSFSFFRGGEADLAQLHLVVGGILYNVSILLGLLALFSGFRRRWLIVGVCVGQYVLLHVQFLLGLNSRENAELLAYHIPVGVLIFFLAYLTVALGFGVRVESEQA